MEAKTATIVLPNTEVNIPLDTGDQSVAGTYDDVYTISNEKMEAKIPAITI